MASRLPTEHPNRSLILAVLHEHPGVGFRELTRLTGLASGTMQHHVRLLVRQGRVWTTRLSPRILHYAGARPYTDVEIRCEVVDHALDQVDQELVHLASHSVNQKAVLDAFNGRMPRSTVQARLGALCRRGLMRLERAGRYINYQSLPVRLSNPHMPTPVPVAIEIQV
jgi:predicted transcriptional regulator